MNDSDRRHSASVVLPLYLSPHWQDFSDVMTDCCFLRKETAGGEVLSAYMQNRPYTKDQLVQVGNPVQFVINMWEYMKEYV